MRKVGIRYYDTNLTEENFQAMKDGGINATELSLVQKPEELDFKKVRELADKYEIHLWSCHLPFKPTEKADFSVVDRELRNKIIAAQLEYIKKGCDIGIDKFVLHPSFVLKPEDNRADRINAAMESLDFIAEVAAKDGATIAVENMIPRCLGRSADELAHIISANDKLRICFDVNHLLCDTHEDFIKKLGDKIITTHISDYDFVDERHWFPGEGKIDWVKLYKMLCEAGYEGTWMYELSPGVKTELRSRELTVSDFRNNAEEIFAGKVPSRI